MGTVQAPAPIDWAAPHYAVPLLITPGDQVYVDEMWRTVLSTRWCDKPLHADIAGGVRLALNFGSRVVIHGRPLSRLWTRQRVTR